MFVSGSSLTTKKQNYVETKKKVAEEIQMKNGFLNNLEPQLNTVLKVKLYFIVIYIVFLLLYVNTLTLIFKLCI